MDWFVPPADEDMVALENNGPFGLFLDACLDQLMQAPDMNMVIAQSKAWAKSQWFTDDGEQFWPRDAETDEPDMRIHAASKEVVVHSTQEMFRKLYRYSKLFDRFLKPKLQQIMDGPGSKLERIDRIYWYRIHYPAHAGCRLPLRDDDGALDGFCYAWEWSKRQGTGRKPSAERRRSDRHINSLFREKSDLWDYSVCSNAPVDDVQATVRSLLHTEGSCLCPLHHRRTCVRGEACLCSDAKAQCFQAPSVFITLAPGLATEWLLSDPCECSSVTRRAMAIRLGAVQARATCQFGVHVPHFRSRLGEERLGTVVEYSDVWSEGTVYEYPALFEGVFSPLSWHPPSVPSILSAPPIACLSLTSQYSQYASYVSRDACNVPQTNSPWVAKATFNAVVQKYQSLAPTVAIEQLKKVIEDLGAQIAENERQRAAAASTRKGGFTKRNGTLRGEIETLRKVLQHFEDQIPKLQDTDATSKDLGTSKDVAVSKDPPTDEVRANSITTSPAKNESLMDMGQRVISAMRLLGSGSLPTSGPSSASAPSPDMPPPVQRSRTSSSTPSSPTVLQPPTPTSMDERVKRAVENLGSVTATTTHTTPVPLPASTANNPTSHTVPTPPSASSTNHAVQPPSKEYTAKSSTSHLAPPPSPASGPNLTAPAPPKAPSIPPNPQPGPPQHLSTPKSPSTRSFERNRTQ
ncbi:hypothetical protein NMY22_g196 [Coprinellus aureogranulatus]|nr:hypothetical protein NMY22_g196 [Coprinellus aureogranulatus]